SVPWCTTTTAATYTQAKMVEITAIRSTAAIGPERADNSEILPTMTDVKPAASADATTYRHTESTTAPIPTDIGRRAYHSPSSNSIRSLPINVRPAPSPIPTNASMESAYRKYRWC